MGKEKFSKEMTILEALRFHPKAREVFDQFGMGCLGCMGAELESIENGARMHGINVEQLVRTLNELVQK